MNGAIRKIDERDNPSILTERALLRKVFAVVTVPGSEAGRKEKLRRLYADAQARQGRAFAEEELALWSSPWMHTLLSIDPQAVLRQVRCPVLALVGDKDQVVRADANVPALAQALAANPAARVERLPGLNHFFQTARTGDFSEVESIHETMSAKALALIGTWAGRQVAR